MILKSHATSEKRTAPEESIGDQAFVAKVFSFTKRANSQRVIARCGEVWATGITRRSKVLIHMTGARVIQYDTPNFTTAVDSQPADFSRPTLAVEDDGILPAISRHESDRPLQAEDH